MAEARRSRSTQPDAAPPPPPRRPPDAGEPMLGRPRALGLARRECEATRLAFSWRTIHGEECSGYWPAGTAAFHIKADIANAVIHYVNTTGDAPFQRDAGVDLLVQ